MASNYTENYKLPLWEGGDSVLREEFNEAHEKVDAALDTFVYKKIKCTQTDENAREVNLDVSDIDFTQYLRIDMFFVSEPLYSIDSVSVLLNGLTSAHCAHLTMGDNSGTSNLYKEFAKIYSYNTTGYISFYTPAANAYVGCVCSTCYPSSNGTVRWFNMSSTSTVVTWSTLQTISIVLPDGAANAAYIPAGAQIILCGIKK